VNPDTAAFTEVDLDEIIKEAKEKYQSLIEETGAMISSDHLPVVRANKKQMAQLFQHLLENALKFRNREVPEINLTLKKEDDSWVIGIKDNGIGIDPAFAEKIFIIFRRLHNDESGYGGTGIGLALCKKITELHGGEIWVEPAGENGSIFYFSLPVRS
jgi:light-regulated signal transduction histidine kinase (bacteriophytochrome)